jgi:hypothetical protein
MLAAPSSPAVAGLQAAVVAGLTLGFGYLIADALLGRRDADRVMRWGLALPGFAAFTVLLMLLHMATGGGLLSRPWLTRGLTVAISIGLLGWKLAISRRHKGDPLGPSDALLAGLVVVSMLVWGTPVFRIMPLHYGGDTSWHAGFATQLLNGEVTPTAAITGDIPNQYPWLFHSMTALLAAFTPGGRAYHALGPLQLLLPAGAVLSLVALGREITGKLGTGIAAGLLGALAGGLGFFGLRGLDLVLHPRAEAGAEGMRYLGDLLIKRSHNIAFHHLAPPYPRELSYVLLVGFLLLLVAGLRRQSLGLVALSGAVLGMTGLAGAEALIVGAGVAVLILVLPVGMPRSRLAGALILPAVALYSIWLLPLTVNYVRLGGFVNITDVEPVNLPLLGILVSWGISTPFAVYGAIRWGPLLRRDIGIRVPLAMVLSAGAILLLSAVIPGALGEAFLSLGRRHRYWPLLHLGVVLWGAVGLSDLLERLHPWRRWLVPVVAVAVVALAVPSPVVASLAFPDKIRHREDVGASLLGHGGRVIDVLATRIGQRCVVAVSGPVTQLAVFSYTGFRLVAASWKTNNPTNKARIRWRDIYRYVPFDPERVADNRVLTIGGDNPTYWRWLVDKHGVDAVVVSGNDAPNPVFRPYPSEPVPLDPGTVVVWVGSCKG